MQVGAISIERLAVMRVVLLAACLVAANGHVRAASLAELFSGTSPAQLTTGNVAEYFNPLMVINNLSRDQCNPVFKVTTGSRLPVAASFIGTTLHSRCSNLQKVIMMTFQFRSDAPAKDVTALGDALRRLNGEPCFEGSDNGRPGICWSNKDHVLGLIEGIDAGKGYTVALCSRLAVTPPRDEADEQAYRI